MVLGSFDFITVRERGRQREDERKKREESSDRKSCTCSRTAARDQADSAVVVSPYVASSCPEDSWSSFEEANSQSTTDAGPGGSDPASDPASEAVSEAASEAVSEAASDEARVMRRVRQCAMLCMRAVHAESDTLCDAVSQ